MGARWEREASEGPEWGSANGPEGTIGTAAAAAAADEEEEEDEEEDEWVAVDGAGGTNTADGACAFEDDGVMAGVGAGVGVGVDLELLLLPDEEDVMISSCSIAVSIVASTQKGWINEIWGTKGAKIRSYIHGFRVISRQLMQNVRKVK